MLYQDRFFRDKFGVRKPGEREHRRAREHAPSRDEIDAEREMLRTAFSQRELVNLKRWQ